MGIVISTNIPSMVAQTNLQKTNISLNKSIERLSSGQKINSSQDDPAGLAISDRMRAQIMGLKQAEKNAADGISALQVAEGGMVEIGNILIRMRELALQSANGTLTATDRSYLNTEFSQLRTEVDRISTTTNFNGIALLSGAFSVTGMILQVGLNNTSKDMMTIRIVSVGNSSLGSVGEMVLSQMTISQSAGTARNTLKYLDAAINDINQARSTIGAQLSRLNATGRNLSVNIMNLSSANSRIRDVDVASETADLTKAQILMQSGVSVLSQANNNPQVALSLLS